MDMKGKVIGLTSLVLLSAIANAQLQEFNAKTDGKGGLLFHNKTVPTGIGKVQVILQKGGKAEVRLLDGSKETFFGDWQAQGDRTVRLMINRWGNDPASGFGTLERDVLGHLIRIIFNGSIGNLPFSFRFNSYGPRGINGPVSDQMFIDQAHDAVQCRYPDNLISTWNNESISGTVFGNRTVTGQALISAGLMNNLRIQYTVVLSAGTATVRSVDVRRY